VGQGIRQGGTSFKKTIGYTYRFLIPCSLCGKDAEIQLCELRKEIKKNFRERALFKAMFAKSPRGKERKKMSEMRHSNSIGAGARNIVGKSVAIQKRNWRQNLAISATKNSSQEIQGRNTVRDGVQTRLTRN